MTPLCALPLSSSSPNSAGQHVPDDGDRPPGPTAVPAPTRSPPHGWPASGSPPDLTAGATPQEFSRTPRRRWAIPSPGSGRPTCKPPAGGAAASFAAVLILVVGLVVVGVISFFIEGVKTVSG